MKKERLSLLVLSCDKYKHAWDDFFNLRDKFWPECPYNWYLVTETEDYQRDNVTLIKCGKELNWTGRFKHAAQVANTKYVALLLEDYFFESPIDTNVIEEDLDVMDKENVSIINVGDWWNWLINQPNRKFYNEHLVYIDNHLRSGIGAVPVIWNTQYLFEVLGDKDCNAWEFEIDRCKEAASEHGYKGTLLVDDRKPLNTSVVPVIIQGKLYPKCVNYFKKRGYNIDTSKYIVMSTKEVLRYQFKHYAAKITFGRNFLKWVGTHVFGYTFFSEKYGK